MNKFLLVCGLMFIFSCNKKDVSVEDNSNVMIEEPVIKVVDSASVDPQEGLALIEGADCLTCHKVDGPLVGPSYQDIANKYSEADIDNLADKIIAGGKGVWGEVPMAAHVGVSKDDARKMVKYILTLKQ